MLESTGIGIPSPSDEGAVLAIRDYAKKLIETLLPNSDQDGIESEDVVGKIMFAQPQAQISEVLSKWIMSNADPQQQQQQSVLYIVKERIMQSQDVVQGGGSVSKGKGD
jgi:hypothetical protein